MTKRQAKPTPEIDPVYTRRKPLKLNDWGEVSTSHLPVLAPMLGVGQTVQTYRVPGDTSPVKYRSMIVTTKRGENTADAEPQTDAELKAEIMEMLKRAGEACKLLDVPPEVRALSKVVKSQEFVREASDWAAHEATRSRRLPTSEEIGDLDTVLDWLLWLEVDKRKIIGATMLGVGVRLIGVQIGMSKSKVQGLKTTAIDQIVGWRKAGRT